MRIKCHAALHQKKDLLYMYNVYCIYIYVCVCVYMILCRYTYSLFIRVQSKAFLPPSTIVEEHVDQHLRL